MNATVAIPVSAELFVRIYAVYGEDTPDAITRVLEDAMQAGSTAQRAGQATTQDAVSFRPSEGTVTGRVWEIADQIKQETGAAMRIDVVEACIEEGINPNTASTQFSHWNKENNVCQDLLKAARYLQSTGMTDQQLTQLHHSGRETLAATKRYFSRNMQLQGNNLRYAQRLVRVEELVQGGAPLADAIGKALEEIPLGISEHQ